LCRRETLAKLKQKLKQSKSLLPQMLRKKLSKPGKHTQTPMLTHMDPDQPSLGNTAAFLPSTARVCRDVKGTKTPASSAGSDVEGGSPEPGLDMLDLPDLQMDDGEAKRRKVKKRKKRTSSMASFDDDGEA
jgi:hypothetical protein